VTLEVKTRIPEGKRKEAAKEIGDKPQENLLA
jgi:hypothetical protein